MFDLLVSADAFVPDHAAAVEQAAKELGIRRLDERRFVRSAAQRTEWSFSPVHPDRRVAPTLLEFLAPMDVNGPWKQSTDYAYLPEIASTQSGRPARLHSTPVAVGDVLAVADRLAARGAPYRLDQPSAELPFHRLWVGFGPDTGSAYSPDGDGGTHLEFIPTEALGLPEPGPSTVDAPLEGLPVRIAARVIVAEDLDETLRRLESNLGWSPSERAIASSDGIRRARLGFSYPHSATIELIQPAPDATGYEAQFAQSHGPGACSFRFEVCGVEVARERLHSLGAPTVDAADIDDRRRFIRPAEFSLGTAFEFVEYAGD